MIWTATLICKMDKINFRIIAIVHDSETEMAYDIIFEDGTEFVSSVDDLLSLDQIKRSALGQKGIIEVKRLSHNTWRIITNKSVVR